MDVVYTTSAEDKKKKVPQPKKVEPKPKLEKPKPAVREKQDAGIEGAHIGLWFPFPVECRGSHSSCSRSRFH